jgi:SulP family sulfate permease
LITPRLAFRPRLIQSLRAGYSRQDFTADLSAGITVGVVALPLAMAFAIASGVKPEAGLFTAIIAGFLISALGGSRVQIGGPAGAFVALLYAIVERYGLANLLLATMMSGVLLFVLGALRLGQLIRYIPVSIVTGFTNGIAVIIALQQVRDALGLQIDKMPAHFFAQLGALWQQLPTWNPAACALCVGSIALVAAWPKSYQPLQARWRRVLSRVPGTIIVLILGVVAVRMGLSVETIGSRFGGIPHGLPALSWPNADWDSMRNLFAPTVSIALLGAIESLLCARVADGMTHDRHDPNQELMAQGVANMVAPLFGGIAATGTIARTVTNVRSGARTPVAGMVHALTLLAILMVLSPVAADIPMASLAAILLFVAWNMGDWGAFGRLKHFSLSYRTILLATFALTVMVDITAAVEVGLVMACLFFIHRVAGLTRVERLPLPEGPLVDPQGRTAHAWRLFGSVFFGSVDKLDRLYEPSGSPPALLLLDMSRVINLDTTGLDALESLQADLQSRGGDLVIVQPAEQPLSLMRRSGFIDRIGSDRMCADLDTACEMLRLRPAKPASS